MIVPADPTKSVLTAYYYEVAARATTLRERIDEPHRFAFQDVSEQKLVERYDVWRKSVAPENPERFARRLGNDQLIESGAARLLRPVTIELEEHLPGWIFCFRDLMTFLEEYDPAANLEDTVRLFGQDAENKIPFLHLITPLVTFAISRPEISHKLTHSDLLNPESRCMANQYLARLLSNYASQTLDLEFRVYQSTCHSALGRMLSNADSGSGKELYQGFCNRILAGGWPAFFSEYSVLARLITLITSYWIRNTDDFFARLDSDLTEITRHFCGGVPPGKVVRYQPGLSDPHDGGQGVIALEFESGFKLVYKPKNLELELAWSEYLTWFNHNGLEPSLRPLDIINRGTYGWAGFVEPAECVSIKEVSDFYKRMGALIGCVYLLNGNDCHHENLIASGAHPVLIDLESVMHHQVETAATQGIRGALLIANELIGSSVLNTGLLPVWTEASKGFVFDSSAMGGYDPVESPYQRPQWSFINTDRMKLVFTTGGKRVTRSLPVFLGREQPPDEYAEDIIAGFKNFYRIVIRNKQEVPVHLFAGKELRFIFRATRIYGLITKKLMNPMYMREGIDRSLQIEALCRPFLHSESPDPLWGILKSEIRQMEAADIPIFRSLSDSAEITSPEGSVGTAFMTAPVYNQVIERLPSLDDDDLARQLKFIRASLLLRNLTHDAPKTFGQPIQLGNAVADLTPGFLLELTLAIARNLDSEAIYSADGSCTWISAGLIAGSDRFRLQPLSMHLYDGLPGVAIFLSALSTKTSDRQVSKLNEAVMRSIRNEILNMKKTGILTGTGPGGIGQGLPSLIYALSRISGFLKDRPLLDDAVSLSELITPAAIGNDQYFDIIAGSAGCLLSMLTMYRETGSQQALEKAVLCGELLLKKSIQNPISLTGFSHGQAGIAHALLKLYEATGDAKYLDAATSAIRYENTRFSAKHQNWYDLRDNKTRKDTGPAFMTSWCHGAPGIGLARLAAQPILCNPQIESDIQRAFATTMNGAMQDRDHLCCGNLGLADILLEGALRTGDDVLRKRSAEVTGMVLQRASKTGHFALLTGYGKDFFNPGFFQGVSGIGYALLRQAYPNEFPSVLLFE